MVKISVITPTIRLEGLRLIENALVRQNIDVDFEWLVCSKKMPSDYIVADYDVGWMRDYHQGGVWTLNRAYNELISKAKGDLIVSWQDYTYADHDCLQKFWDIYEADNNAIVSAVGNKYSDDSWTNKVWQDPRERSDFGTFYECNPADIEWNLCSVPKKAMFDIGGFDEEMDFLGYGMDGYAVNYRIDTLGEYKFYLDQTNKSYSLEHGRADNWEEKNLLHGGYAKRRQELIDLGVYPRLKYLNKDKS
jgi:hypothetical protein